MLRWRLIVGSFVVAVLAGLCWLDHGAAIPGQWLGPVALLLALLATHELLGLCAAGGITPRPLVVYGGVALMVASNWLGLAVATDSSRDGTDGFGSFGGGFAGLGLAMALALAAAFMAEMQRFDRPGKTLAPLAASAFALVYVGLMLSFAVQLRLAFGIGALVSLVLVVKLADTGAYTVGRLLGRHKMAPVLSPGKTWEGAAGAVVFALAGAGLSAIGLGRAASVPPDAPCLPPPWGGWIAYGLVLAVMGMLGDLAESLLKRDAGRKDSSTWLPGLGGVLDMLDSILLAAPAAYLFWALGLVGRR